MTRRWVLQGLMTLAIVTLALAGYDRYIVGPSRQVGIVNLTAVYEEKERELTDRLVREGGPNVVIHRDAVVAETKRFAEGWPKALKELSADCRCGVIVPDGAVLGGVATVDLTPQFRQKVGLK